MLLTSKTLLAQEQMEPEWAAKPIQCMPLNEAFTKSRELGQYTSWGGLGKSNSVNHAGALDVFVISNDGASYHFEPGHYWKSMKNKQMRV